jgi:hypothetical protein
MFFAIFWTAFIPFGMVILSLVADWLRHSFQEVRTSSVPAADQARGCGKIGPVGGSAEAKASANQQIRRNPPNAVAISAKRAMWVQLISGLRSTHWPSSRHHRILQQSRRQETKCTNL